MIDINYVAGLFDGEGFVRIERQTFASKHTKWHDSRVNFYPTQKAGHIRFVVYAGINMTDPRSVRLVYERFGGYFKSPRKPSKPTHRPLHAWIVASRFAYRFLVEVMPYLIIKREEADLAIEFQEHIMNRGGSKRHCGWMSEEEIAYRNRCHDVMAALKHVIHP